MLRNRTSFTFFFVPESAQQLLDECGPGNVEAKLMVPSSRENVYQFIVLCDHAAGLPGVNVTW